MNNNSNNNLQTFSHLLESHLHSVIPNTESVTIQSVIKEGCLMILAQHPAHTDVVPDTEQVFQVLEQLIQSEKPPFSTDIKLYVRLEGEKRPYAFHKFYINLPITQKEREGVSETTFNPDYEIITNESINSFFDDDDDEIEYNQHHQNIIDPPHQPVTNEDNIAENTAINKEKKSAKLPIIVALASVGLIAFLGGLYALSRPCVVGTCTAISEAESLSQKYNSMLQQKTSFKDIMQAKKQLENSIKILKKIPFWSNNYNQAQKKLPDYQGQLNRINQLITALTKADLAGQKALNPPHTEAQWQEIQKLWLETIQALGKIPKSSEVYQLAQQKQKAYKINLSAINKRIATEKKANKSLEQAKEAGKKADVRQGVADSLAHWQLVYASWQTAVNKLGEIPPGTTAYQEAQKLLKEYQEKLITGRDRTTREQFGSNTYKQGLLLAQKAKNYQIGNQWSLAVYSWRTALNYVKQVPPDTFYDSKAKQLINSYTQALKLAETQLKLANTAQQVRGDLMFVCAGRPQICNYAISRTLIKVRLTESYVQTIQKTAITAKIRGDANSQKVLYNHISAIGEALKTISKNSGIRLEVYTPDGILREVYNPQTPN